MVCEKDDIEHVLNFEKDSQSALRELQQSLICLAAKEWRQKTISTRKIFWKFQYRVCTSKFRHWDN